MERGNPKATCSGRWITSAELVFEQQSTDGGEKPWGDAVVDSEAERLGPCIRDRLLVEDVIESPPAGENRRVYVVQVER
ncbi:uncharacterized protein ColSpa_11232 [Colletotrichum spaethianum]|uniref:Uncharacterized protein n=1 Tax=Colletotrichum spaethianum TaxID=700344 RepID=A0AA37PEY4_9PEZI|nr:uncharacterized protein ColSpa_11232 [Colletotrichum spaethianum]GKT51051.1 hypothetical protein ColSpa_11232 [Colletotrichum spaethianum]